MRSYRTSFHVPTVPTATDRGTGGNQGDGDSKGSEFDGRDDVCDYVENNLGLLKDVAMDGGKEARACALTFLSCCGTEADFDEAQEELDRLKEERTGGRGSQTRAELKEDVRPYIPEDPEALASILSARTREAKATSIVILSAGASLQDLEGVEEALARLREGRFG